MIDSRCGTTNTVGDQCNRAPDQATDNTQGCLCIVEPALVSATTAQVITHVCIPGQSTAV